MYYSTSNKFLTIINNDDLSGTHGPLGLFEDDFYVTVPDVDALDCLILLTIPDLGTSKEWECSRSPDPVPIGGDEFIRIEFEFRFGSDGEDIILDVFADNEECRTTADLDPLALPDGVAEYSFVLSEYIPFRIDDIPGAFLDLLFEEFFHRDLADETESLTVLA